MSTTSKKVCIIGAGPRGIVTARHLSGIPNLEISVFEAKEDLGGLWLYKEPKTEVQAEEKQQADNYYRLYNCTQDSMYDTLITNLPYFFMEYKDLGMRDVDKDLPLFVPITTYKQYLDVYAEKFDLRKYMQFKTLIKSVRLYNNLSEEEKENVRGVPKKFVVKTVDAQGDSLNANEKYHSFDYVIVTSGQYSFPYIPSIPNADSFQGTALHYKNFGSPNSTNYRNKKVLIVGGSDGAHDLLIQFFSSDVPRVQDCQKVILCSRKVDHVRGSEDFNKYIKDGRLSLHEGSVKSFKGMNTVCFSDGTEEEVDTVIYATGYKLKFPYFNPEDGLIDHDENENRGVFFGPLYKKFISIREPDLFFIGYLETTLVVNILPELQALTARYIIEGKLKVPSQDKMYKEYNQEIEDHMTHIGSLALFYKTDLSLKFPGLPNNYEHNEWLFFSNWLKEVYPDNNDEKADEYFNIIANTKKALMKFKAEGNFLQYKKFDYHEVYPKDFRNTSDFV